jgi:heme A synthase
LIIALLILNGVQLYIEISVGRRFSSDSNFWVNMAVVLVVYLANYYVLVIRGYGIKFESEFSNLEKSRKVLLLVSCSVLLLATTTFFSTHFLPIIVFFTSFLKVVFE